MLLTGGLHLDGLMDTCDGVFCVRSPEERLVIMRDSHVGAFGVLGAVCLLLVKFAALGALLAGDRQLLLGGLLVAPMLSRWAMVLAAVCFPYGRSGETLGSSFHRTVGPVQLAATLAYLVARFALSRLPGLTGDVYGAINEVIETLVLVTFTLHWGG